MPYLLSYNLVVAKELGWGCFVLSVGSVLAVFSTLWMLDTQGSSLLILVMPIVSMVLTIYYLTQVRDWFSRKRGIEPELVPSPTVETVFDGSLGALCGFLLGHAIVILLYFQGLTGSADLYGPAIKLGSTLVFGLGFVLLTLRSIKRRAKS